MHTGIMRIVLQMSSRVVIDIGKNWSNYANL